LSLSAMWEQLARSGVRFVVVGGVAAIAQGSARDTHDLDVCYDPEPDNVAKVVRLLNAWHARLRTPNGSGSELPFVIDARTFRDSPGLTLETDLGWIDLMDRVTGIGDYAAVRAKSEAVTVGHVTLHVLTLDALIAAKRATGRRMDHEHLIELEALRALKRAEAKPARAPRRRWR
jgi:predicted nucleotidyltransferase